QMTNGKWQMTNGKWQMAIGKWQMTNGKWQIIVRLPGVSRKSQILKMWLTSVFAASATKAKFSKCG
ncbi:MAG: hypothetical protein J6V14_02675, partial [Clostridia bacterium]|nr:hypothetical protein [Clostridia bacterium]